jgi:hypothetical protein
MLENMERYIAARRRRMVYRAPSIEAHLDEAYRLHKAGAIDDEDLGDLERALRGTKDLGDAGSMPSYETGQRLTQVP